MAKIKTESVIEKGTVKTEQTVAQARDLVRMQQQEAAKSEQSAIQLEQELRELQTAEQKRKEAETRGTETAEKMEEVSG